MRRRKAGKESASCSRSGIRSNGVGVNNRLVVSACLSGIYSDPVGVGLELNAKVSELIDEFPQRMPGITVDLVGKNQFLKHRARNAPPTLRRQIEQECELPR